MTEEFEAWLLRRGRGRSAATYATYIRRYLADPAAYVAAITGSESAPNYRRFLAAALRSWAKFSKDKKLLEWFEELRLPAAVPQDVREPFPMEEWQEIRDEIDQARYLKPPIRLVCGVIATRGIRCGDVVRVKIHELESALKTGVLAFEGKSERRLTYSAEPLRKYFKGMLELPRADQKDARVRDLVCRSGNQNTATKAIRRGLDRVAAHIGVDPKDIYAHRFRHTYATHFLQAMVGDPEAIFKLQQQMGWARLETASNYLRRSRQAELDVIEERVLGKNKDS